MFGEDSGYPYLQSIETSGEDAYSQYYSEVSITKQTFIDKIKEKHDDFEIDFNDSNCINILEYTNGNRVKKIKIGKASRPIPRSNISKVQRLEAPEVIICISA